MARPLKSQDWAVHRFAEVIQMADGIHENEEVRKAIASGGIVFVMADERPLIIHTLDEISLGRDALASKGANGNATRQNVA